MIEPDEACKKLLSNHRRISCELLLSRFSIQWSVISRSIFVFAHFVYAFIII